MGQLPSKCRECTKHHEVVDDFGLYELPVHMCFLANRGYKPRLISWKDFKNDKIPDWCPIWNFEEVMNIVRENTECSGARKKTRSS